jgi:outer membrane phospholipase A
MPISFAIRFFLVFVFFFSKNLAHAEDEFPEMKKKDDILDESFSRYRDIYFLVGSPESKGQLSLKIRPIHQIGFYVTYTQVMFWSLAKVSKPFKDINFSPEAFYQWDMSSGVPSFLRFGVQHKSNGKDGESSRSYDTVFADIGQVSNLSEVRLQSELRLFYIYDIDWKTNRNIKEYLGLWNARVIVVPFVKTGKWVLSLSLRPASFC